MTNAKSQKLVGLIRVSLNFSRSCHSGYLRHKRYIRLTWSTQNSRAMKDAQCSQRLPIFSGNGVEVTKLLE